jgi:hypothetical protein
LALRTHELCPNHSQGHSVRQGGGRWPRCSVEVLDPSHHY